MKDLTDFEKKMIVGGKCAANKDDDDPWIDPFVLAAGPEDDDDIIQPQT